MFTTTATGAARASRFAPTDGASVDTLKTLDDGTVIRGRAWIGKDRAGDLHLVHSIAGGADQSAALYAVATAIAGGKVIPPDALVSAFVETGKLAALKRAVDAAVKAEAESK